MSNIRKQAIISSLLVYVGVLVGAINTYFFVKEGSFTPEQYGLTRLFFDVAQNFFAWASLGVIPVIFKFYPYYKDHLPHRKIDLLTWALSIAFVGFIIVIAGALIFEPVVVRKFSRGSALFVEYYHWVFVFAFGMLFFSVVEGYSWALQKSVVSNFLKETLLRIFTTLFIVLYLFNIIDFDIFIKLFSFLFIIVLVVLVIHLASIKKLPITFSISKVTRRFYKKMFGMQSLVFSGICIMTLGQTIDSIMIAGVQGLTQTGIYSLAQFAANIVQIPQRSIQSVSTGVLAQHWKAKNYAEIGRIYERSCINLLLIALVIFGNLWLNIDAVFTVMNIQQEYAVGIQVIFVLGVARIIDAGTGVNGPVIGTSTFWRFDFFTGVIMLAVRLPLAYLMLRAYGMTGMAFSELISMASYNFVRFEFLRRKFKMQPFNMNTVLALVVTGMAFAIAYFLLQNVGGWTGIFSRSILFSLLVIGGVFGFKITPDAHQLLDKLKQRFR
ncbi:lipopolysaccharide biosynthesis protein [Aridibaculum aurantiacum]|uniref:lipopolysaccharide biosynthesis protein n=1 Tax=Aridibaculum aurantiacum TaxID=2810307 RepID=UPI001A96F1E1|nr:polysaccharide biosynthesis C-terminal domain-containing protein [Aridibaculum aurantiacum]